MSELFAGVSAGALRRLADAFRSGRVGGDCSAFSIAKATNSPQTLIDVVLRLKSEGISPTHLALLLDASAAATEARANHIDADLVWTGPEAGAARNRDTAVVVRELFGEALRDVLVSTFVVRQASHVFRPLAERMDQLPELRGRLFLHVGRDRRDTTVESELLREFAEELDREWPSGRRPEVYYDPRGLVEAPEGRATWHAKCVVVDDDVAFVTSANFTDWAQVRAPRRRDRLFHAIVITHSTAS